MQMIMMHWLSDPVDIHDFWAEWITAKDSLSFYDLVLLFISLIRWRIHGEMAFWMKEILESIEILPTKKLWSPSPNQDFQSHRIDLMVATDAYGQGIDKADIRLIVHWEPPVNLEMRPELVVGVGWCGEEEPWGDLCCDLCFNPGVNFGGFVHSFPMKVEFVWFVCFSLFILFRCIHYYMFI